MAEHVAVSDWPALDAALDAGSRAFGEMQRRGPASWAAVLDALATGVAAAAAELVETARAETGLTTVRLADVELPRTIDQLRQCAAAAAGRTWCDPVISPRARIGSYLASLPGVVVVFGPNNFPYAFNAVGGGDFAAAVATGHPVLAKGNPGHPATTAALARIAAAAVAEAGLDPATVQMVQTVADDDGRRLVADARVAASAFTGSRHAGLALKEAADRAGRPIHLELSSVNPVVVLPGAVRERSGDVAAALAASMTAASGQFCTSPGLLLMLADDAAAFVPELVARLADQPPHPLLGPGVAAGLRTAVATVTTAGAELVWRAEQPPEGCEPTTLLRVDGERFVARPDTFQTEMFGNAALLVAAADTEELERCLALLHGNLTGTIFAAADGSDEARYGAVAALLRPRVGRLLDDKVPTGVAVVDAMNHGGPYPATANPATTAVGVPSSLRRFAMLQCFDGVADHHLPPELQAANPLGLQRRVDGEWTRAPIVWGG